MHYSIIAEENTLKMKQNRLQATQYKSKSSCSHAIRKESKPGHKLPLVLVAGSRVSVTWMEHAGFFFFCPW